MKTIKENNLIVIPRSEIKASVDIKDIIKKVIKMERPEQESIGFMFNGVPVVLSNYEISRINYSECIEEECMMFIAVMKRYHQQLSLIHPFPSDKFD